MHLSATFAAVRHRIANGMIEPRLFMAQDWTPGPTYGRNRPQTFAERRRAYESVIETARRIEEGQRYADFRAAIIAETPACRDLIASIRALENLPFGMSMEADAAPLRDELETIIAGRMAEAAVDRRAAA